MLGSRSCNELAIVLYYSRCAGYNCERAPRKFIRRMRVRAALWYLSHRGGCAFLFASVTKEGNADRVSVFGSRSRPVWNDFATVSHSRINCRRYLGNNAILQVARENRFSHVNGMLHRAHSWYICVPKTCAHATWETWALIVTMTNYIAPTAAAAAAVTKIRKIFAKSRRHDLYWYVGIVLQTRHWTFHVIRRRYDTRLRLYGWPCGIQTLRITIIWTITMDQLGERGDSHDKRENGDEQNEREEVGGRECCYDIFSTGN